MNRKIAFSLLCILITVSACQRNEPESSAIKKDCCTNRIPEDKAATKVMGTWNWIETTYFSETQGKLLKTPLNTGKKLTYTFDRDSLIISSEGSVTDRVRYEIGMLRDITRFPQDTTLIIRLSDSRDQKRISLLHFCGDNIILVNSYNNLGGNIMLKRVG
ncbi:MAG: hypothetical protein H6R34_398 [Bacteroidetes bacterium]|jgi:hypothetical protein|nr:hypothetical protein [Bacteroidota bacterium]